MSFLSFVRIVGVVLANTPTYVWLLLAAALMLGARRLKPRRTHFAVAALPPALFMAMGLWFAASVEAPFSSVAASWATSFTLGAATSPLRLVPRPKRARGLLFDFAPSAVPITAYLGIFSTHYGVGIWSAFVPELSVRLSLAGLGVSGITAGRTIADFLLIFRTSGRCGTACAQAPTITAEAVTIPSSCKTPV